MRHNILEPVISTRCRSLFLSKVIEAPPKWDHWSDDKTTRAAEEKYQLQISNSTWLEALKSYASTPA